MRKLSQLCERYRGKNIAIIGMGVSNTPMIELLIQHNIPFTVRDKNPDPSLQEKFEKCGVSFITGDGYLENFTEDILFRTPGVNPASPQLQKAIENKAVITSEMGEFFNLCPCSIIAVTGSDGKTTTTSLIAKFLEASGKKVFLGGNIGTPLLYQVDDIRSEDFAVVELSSFQLMDLCCDPIVAVVTNVTPNHLDYHKDMVEYAEAKQRIFSKQSPSHKLILNYDNQFCRENWNPSVDTTSYFSRLSPFAEKSLHAVFRDNCIYIDDTPWLPVDKIQLKGVHNIENYMAAILAVEDFCTPAQVCDVAQNFFGVPHRMQFVQKINGVSYYNDSIGTSPTRTIAGLRSFDERIILIAGGYDKGIPFDELGAEILGQVKHLLLIGATAEAIATAVESDHECPLPRTLDGEQPCIFHCGDLTAAVRKANTLAEDGDCVVLSPACAAFDQFKNFAHRGQYFEKLVNKLQIETERSCSILNTLDSWDYQALLEKLCSISAPTGFEEPVTTLATELLRPYVDEIYQNPLGSVIAVRRSQKKNAKKILLDAHLDEIGFIVTGHKDGFLQFAPLGGVDPRMLPDRELTILTNPPHFGIVACTPPHVQTAEDQQKALPLKELFIDVGLTQEEAEKEIPIGTPATYVGTCQPLGDNLLWGKAMDDRACFVSLIGALELLKDQSLDCDLYILGSVDEERGSSGAITAMWELAPDCCVAVDVTHGDTPDSKKKDVFPLGKGPAIGRGPNCTKWMEQRLFALAKKEEIPVQMEVMAGSSGTNGWPMQISREGVATAVVSLPLRYMHTPLETFHREDLINTAKLLASFVIDYAETGGQ